MMNVLRNTLAAVTPLASIQFSDWKQAVSVLLEIAIPIAVYVLGTALFRHYMQQGRQKLQHAALLQSCEGAIFSTSLDGTIISWNRGAERLLGYSEAEILGCNVAVLVPPDAHDQLVALTPLVIQGQSFQSQETTRLTKDGRRLDVAASVSPLRNSKGKIIGTARILRDVTDARRIAQELKHAKEEAEAANRAKSIFLATMSHEIRTPLTAVIGYTELLQSPALNDADRIKWTRTIATSGRRLLEILNDILDLSKIEAGQMDLRREPCSLRQIVDEVVRLLRPQVISKGLSFSTVVSEQVPQLVETDPMKVRQILLNLVGNAVKFTSKGSVDLVVRVADMNDGSRVYFDVTDTGPGITAETQQRLFKPFVQGDSSTVRRHGGTGLGLVISSRLAKMLGGELTVSSESGHGSTFTASIAAVEAELEPLEIATPLTSWGDAASNTGRVLVVDDSPPIRQLIRQYLVGTKIAVTTASDGREGYRKAIDAWNSGAPFGLILMDLQMPEMDGQQVTEELRRLGYPNAIVAITASVLQDMRSSCLAAGCNDVLYKPFDRMQLLNILAKYLPPESASTSVASEVAMAA